VPIPGVGQPGAPAAAPTAPLLLENARCLCSSTSRWLPRSWENRAPPALICQHRAGIRKPDNRLRSQGGCRSHQHNVRVTALWSPWHRHPRWRAASSRAACCALQPGARPGGKATPGQSRAAVSRPADIPGPLRAEADGDAHARPAALGRPVAGRRDTPGWWQPPRWRPALLRTAAVTVRVADGVGDSQCRDSGVNANEAGRVTKETEEDGKKVA